MKCSLFSMAAFLFAVALGGFGLSFTFIKVVSAAGTAIDNWFATLGIGLAAGASISLVASVVVAVTAIDDCIKRQK